jgi:endonuclease G, mitochondrial
MTDFTAYKGYKEDFLGTGKKVALPKLSAVQKKDLAPVKGNKSNLAHYMHYSLVLSKKRRFPYFTATNIDGKMFKKISRKDNWRRDERIAHEHQWGDELYKATKSDFDRGHMTKREDPQWGPTESHAIKAADSTFFFSNSVPQHGRLNQRIWRLLEDYILHTETRNHDMKVVVLTGPVLSDKDPNFVTEVSGQTVKIPTLFWKIVVFPKSDGKLYRAGFIMSQESLLRDNDIIETFRGVTEAATDEDMLFLEFDEAETYQTSIDNIEKMTGLTMPKAKDIYTDKRSIKLLLKEVDVNAEGLEIGGVSDRSAEENDEMVYEIEGLQL